MADNSSNKKAPGCLRKFFLGLGCGCLYPSLLLLVIAAISWFSFADAVSGIMSPLKIPNFSGPEQEDFWTLQEKRLTLVENHHEAIELQASEFNAFLAGISFPPTQGFCLQRVRFLPGQFNQGQLYLIGSGFFMRSLVFRLGIKVPASGKVEVTQLSVNSWLVPESGLLRRKVEDYLAAVFTAERIPELDILASDSTKLALDGQKIVLPAALVLRKK